MEVAALSSNAVKGILKRYLGEHVYEVNAAYLAEKKVIVINENKTSSTKGFTNLIAVEVITKAERRRVEGTLLNGFGARIVKIDEYRVDVIPKGHLLIIKHKDQPGAIGREIGRANV